MSERRWNVREESGGDEGTRRRGTTRGLAAISVSHSHGVVPTPRHRSACFPLSHTLIHISLSLSRYCARSLSFVTSYRRSQTAPKTAPRSLEGRRRVPAPHAAFVRRHPVRVASSMVSPSSSNSFICHFTPLVDRIALATSATRPLCLWQGRGFAYCLLIFVLLVRASSPGTTPTQLVPLSSFASPQASFPRYVLPDSTFLYLTLSPYLTGLYVAMSFVCNASLLN